MSKTIVIQNNKTGLEYKVTPAEWGRINDNPVFDNVYTEIGEVEEAPKVPKEIKAKAKTTSEAKDNNK